MGMDLWQWHCRNRREKKNCCNWFAENWRGERVVLKKKKKVPYTNNDRFKYNEYIDSYSKKKYIDSYNTKWKKKLIDMHAVKKKKKKYIDSYRRKKWLMCTL